MITEENESKALTECHLIKGKYYILLESEKCAKSLSEVKDAQVTLFNGLKYAVRKMERSDEQRLFEAVPRSDP